MTRFRLLVCSTVLICLGAGPILPQRPAAKVQEGLLVQAELIPANTLILVGQPVVVTALLHNSTDSAVTVGRPPAATTRPRLLTTRSVLITTQPAKTDSVGDAYTFPQGLTVDQVFGAHDKPGGGLRVSAPERSEEMAAKSKVAATVLTGLSLQPKAVVGHRLDLTDYFFGLKEPGTYRVTWNPYAGEVEPAAITLTIEPEKQVVLATDYGVIRLRLFYEEAPRHVANFLELVDSGFYDSLTFNRVIKGLLIQGGDNKGDLSGLRPDGRRIQAEPNSRKHVPGALSMACVPGDPNSGSAQFFICLAVEPSWDGACTVFGETVDKESLAVAQRISEAPTDARNMPIQPIVIRRATAEVIYRQAQR